MSAQARNTTISLFRGTTTNAYGDIIDSGAGPLMRQIPAALYETAASVLDPATQTPMTVRSTECLLPSWTGALNSDQIRDEATGDLYMVEEIIAPPTFIGAPVDLRLTLRRVTATGT